MSTAGRIVLGKTGRPVLVSADGRPLYKAYGLTLDWSTVTPVSGSDVTLTDETVVKVGDSYLRYGQVLTEIGAAEVQTLTLTGGPTGGTFTPTIPASGGNPAQSAAAQAFNVSAANLQAALRLLPRIGPNGVTVGRTGTGTAGDPFIYTLTFARNLADVPQLTATNTFTGGTSPTVTMNTTTPAGATAGLYGPYDSGASDGRQTLERGHVFILEKTILKSELGSDHPIVIEGGICYKDRIIANYSANSLANGPTYANLEAALPMLRYAEA